MRAGMRIRTSSAIDLGGLATARLALEECRRACLYGLPGARQTLYVSRRHRTLGVILTLPLVNWSRLAMDSFEINKILGAVLGTCLVLLSLNIAAGALFAPHVPAKLGFAIEVPENPTEEANKPAEPEQPIEALLA